MMSRAVVFDMDGVLFDSERIISQIWREISILDGIDLNQMEIAIGKCTGLNHTDIGIFFNNHFGDEFDYSGFRKRAAEMFHKKVDTEGLPVKKGVYEILSYLSESSYKIGLASSSSTESIHKNLERAKITDYFQVIIGGDMVEHSKPEPDIYLKACSNLGVDPYGCFAIEDSPNGIRSAKAAGMYPIMVPDMIQPNEEITAILYKQYDSLIDVMEHLKEMEAK